MTRKQEIPSLEDKVLFVGNKHQLGSTLTAIAKRIDFSDRTLNEAVTGERVKGRKGLTKDFRDDLAKKLGIDPGWVEWYDHQPKGRDTLAEFQNKYDTEGRTPPCLEVQHSQVVPPRPATSLTSHRQPGAPWALDPQLCSLTIFGGQYEAVDLDFELSGQPKRITITDETGRRILFDRAIVVSHCTMELDLGGAEIHGGLTALKKAVDRFLTTTEGGNYFITVGGSATAPRLIIESRVGAIDLLRPLVLSATERDGDPAPLCWLADVLPGSQVYARVRIFGAELQDYDVSQPAIGGVADDDEPPSIKRAKGADLPVDDRIRLMRALWEIAKAKEQDPNNMEPGGLTLAFDVRAFEERL